VSTEKSKSRTKTQDAIVALRKTRGLTQQSLAALMGHTTATVGRWEAIREPHSMSLVELAKVARNFEREDLYEIFMEALVRESVIFAAGDPKQTVYGFRRSPEALPAHGSTSPVLLEVAVARLYHWARTEPNPAAFKAHRAYRNVLHAIVAGHAALLAEARKNKMLGLTLAEIEKLQVEIEELQNQEEKRDAGKHKKSE
jgi:transcriptional regulator with XRE-family HTH domain